MNSNTMTDWQIPISEYREVKRRERKEIKELLDTLRESDDPRVLYRDHHVVTDFKDMLRYSAERFPDNIAFMQKYDKRKPFETFTYAQVYDEVNALGTGMVELGLKGKHVSVIGTNCMEWCEAYLAITGGIGVVVPLDKELNEAEIEQLLIKGEVSGIVTVDKTHYSMLKKIKASGKTGLEIIITATTDEHEDAENGLYSFSQLVKQGEEMIERGDRRYLDAQVINSELATILFTSGTTGVSKGVMLTQKMILIDAIVAVTLVEVRPTDVFFSVLPLHHTYEATASFVCPVYSGACIAYCSGLKYILSEISETQPTHMLAVPVIFENFYNKIQRMVKKEKKDKILNALLKMNRVTSRVRLDIAKNATKQITDTFGGNMRTMICGGAAVDAYIMDFFADLGIRAIVGYGLTECSPIIALNPDLKKYTRNDSVGYVLPFSECRIDSPDENGIGEICFRGPTIMLGYYKDQAATDEAIRDGWFYTGDIGYLDKNNYVYITGRKKNVIITGNGKNVFPEEVESYLLRSQYIQEVMVWGDEKNEDPLKRGIYATVRVNEEEVEELLGKGFSEEKVRELIQKEVDKINKGIPLFKKINHVIIRKRDFQKTTSLKIKRFVEDNKNA